MQKVADRIEHPIQPRRKYAYIFIDESGNLDFSNNGTQHFVFTSVVKLRPFSLHSQLLELKYNLWENGYGMEYFHATEDKQDVRNSVFDRIKKNLQTLRIDSLVVEKRKTMPQLQSVENFYPRMLGYLLKYVVTGIQPNLFNEVIVVTDAIPVQKERRAVEKAVKMALSKTLPRQVRYRVVHHASKSNFGLQTADYCSWAIFRKWEKNDRRSYEMIKTAIKSEFDIFSRGAQFYY
jgi:hypothetical protein